MNRPREQARLDVAGDARSPLVEALVDRSLERRGPSNYRAKFPITQEVVDHTMPTAALPGRDEVPLGVEDRVPAADAGVVELEPAAAQVLVQEEQPAGVLRRRSRGEPASQLVDVDVGEDPRERVGIDAVVLEREDELIVVVVAAVVGAREALDQLMALEVLLARARVAPDDRAAPELLGVEAVARKELRATRVLLSKFCQDAMNTAQNPPSGSKTIHLILV